jgi:hypothetical protein
MQMFLVFAGVGEIRRRLKPFLDSIDIFRILIEMTVLAIVLLYYHKVLLVNPVPFHAVD